MGSRIQISLILTNICFLYTSYLVFIQNKFSKPFKSSLGENAVYNLIRSMTEESKFRSDVIPNKEVVVPKEDNEDFENSTKCWICDNDYINGDVKVRDHCHITGKYRTSARINCKISMLN